MTISLRLKDYAVDMSDLNTSDPSHCVLDAHVNATICFEFLFLPPLSPEFLVYVFVNLCMRLSPHPVRPTPLTARLVASE